MIFNVALAVLPFLHYVSAINAGDPCQDDFDCNGLYQCNYNSAARQGSCGVVSNTKGNPFDVQCKGCDWDTKDNKPSYMQCSDCNGEGQNTVLDTEYCQDGNATTSIFSMADANTRHFLACKPRANVNVQSACERCLVYFQPVFSQFFGGRNAASAGLLCVCNGKKVSASLPSSCNSKSNRIKAKYSKKQFKVTSCS